MELGLTAENWSYDSKLRDEGSLASSGTETE